MMQSDTKPREEPVPQAKVEPVKSISAIWLLPLVAVFIGAWLIYQEINRQGQAITIYFDSAEGLEAGKTKIKTHYVDVGLVTSIKLRKGQPGVKVAARIYPEAEHLLQEDTSFWIVTPRVSLSGISGLSTLLSGPFIELSAGVSQLESTEFEGLEDPPITPAGTPGLHITLNSDDEFAYDKGDPIVYKGMPVGQFEDIYFNIEERVVYYNVFIRAPYHQLITQNTRFWNASGIRMELGADGLTVQTGSLETILTNGVTFDIPDGMSPGEVITERAYFDIHKDFAEASANRYKYHAEFMILVEDSLRGLKVGAPVEYRGLHIGTVLEINIEEDKTDQLMQEGHKIPVRIGIHPGRVKLKDDQESVELVHAQLKLWIEKGMRATLETGNIITGGQYVDLQNYSDQGTIELGYAYGVPVIPMISNEFAQITQKVSSILNKINSLPFEDLSQQTYLTLEEFGKAAGSFNQTAENINELLSDAQQKALIAALKDTINAIETLALSYSGQSQTNRSINEALMEMQSLMLEVKPLLHRLNEQPSSLILPDEGKKSEVYPKAKGN